MFRKMQEIDRAFRMVRLFAFCSVLASFGVSLYAIHWFASRLDGAASKVYVLADGKVMEAFRSERRDNLPVEARDHVRTFHEYFFTLSPDDKVIQANMRSALYLADKSAEREYERLQEKGYFRELIAGNVSQEIRVDSVQVGMDKYPYYFKCYATETITRITSITTRSLVTEGYLRNVSRSDNDPHGFLIERWVILENKDLNTSVKPS
jgi:conjugative transposon TraK protein